jgi:hypothetical protein
MVWQAEWRALDARIEGFSASARQLVETYAVRPNDILHVIRSVVIPSGDRLFRDLRNFLTRNESVLPAPAVPILKTFIANHGNSYSSGQAAEELAALQLASVFSTVAAELNYHFVDREVAVRRLAERAFIHLQRSIVVDESLKKRWQEAVREEECESLGAVHLLAHGLWSFKAHSPTARTDLVLSDDLIPDNPLHQNAEALVLTEWKMVKDQSQVEPQARTAYEQAKLYQDGLLAGFELRTRRYIVLVSEEQVRVPADRADGSVVYRHINIARKPANPSSTAKVFAQKTPGSGP